MQYLRHILVYSFSVYLVLLMALPCSDAHRDNNSITAQISELTHQKDNHTQHPEVCTPFCICSGCVAAIVLQPTFEYNFAIPEFLPTEISNFYTPFKSDFFGAIWQPPQLI